MAYDLKLRFANGQVLALRVEKPTVLGRLESNVVDLSPYGTEGMSVSRQHAVILPSNDDLAIRDLDSRNGTFLNDSPLIPHRLYLLRNNDRLMFGKLTSQIVFVRAEIPRQSMLRTNEMPLDLHLNTPPVRTINLEDPNVQKALQILHQILGERANIEALVDMAAAQAVQDPDWSASPRLAVLRIAASFGYIPRDHPDLILEERRFYQSRFSNDDDTRGD